MIRFCFLILFVAVRFDPLKGQTKLNVFNQNTPIHFQSSELASVDNSSYPEFIIEQAHAFYDSIHYQTFWLGKGKAFEHTEHFFNALEDLPDYGLSPSDYNYGSLAHSIPAIYQKHDAAAEPVELDFLITSTFLQMASDLVEGRIQNAGTADNLWVRKKDDFREMEFIMDLKSGQSFNEVFSEMHPDHPFYEPLAEELQSIRRMDEVSYHNFRFSDAAEVVEGYKDPKVKKLRENLVKRGFSLSTDTILVDTILVSAIKSFQESRGIKVDGIPGENTLRYLNMSNGELERLVALNLERMRWVPEAVKGEFLWVNIPEFVLRYYENGEPRAHMKMVAGEIVNSTPVFNDTLTHIIFNPAWTVPQSIIHEEMIPKMIENPRHYVDQNFSIYENGEEINPDTVDWSSKHIDQRYFGMVQHPGVSNSLGLVKFMLPNNLSIYLHDTPADHLFKQEERAFSHGCIRLEKPFELAEMILDDRPEWNHERIETILASGETEEVYLKDPIPVMISYITTWVDQDGNLQIMEDIYGHDQRQLERLSRL